jgi:hypothetical protein
MKKLLLWPAGCFSSLHRGKFAVFCFLSQLFILLLSSVVFAAPNVEDVPRGGEAGGIYHEREAGGGRIFGTDSGAELPFRNVPPDEDLLFKTGTPQPAQEASGNQDAPRGVFIIPEIGSGGRK